jgi:hypothetical protein
LTVTAAAQSRPIASALLTVNRRPARHTASMSPTAHSDSGTSFFTRGVCARKLGHRANIAVALIAAIEPPSCQPHHPISAPKATPSTIIIARLR